MAKRVFLIVLDSFGMGAMPDAAEYGDAGSDTLLTVAQSPAFSAPNLAKLGLFNIDGIAPRLAGRAAPAPLASFARLAERSRGKDTTTGHWEMMGIISEKAMPTFPNGFPPQLIAEYERKTGHKVICNKPYSGTQVLLDYGREQVATNALIVYTSADSVFQVAAHEKYTGLDELYRCCQIARDMLTGELAVGRVIARPYAGEYPDFKRTANRHDYALCPPRPTTLNRLADAGFATIGVGKIHDIFAGDGVFRSFKTQNNADGVQKTLDCMGMEFNGLCFVNLVDFDMVYGHRNDIDGYARAISEFDIGLAQIMERMRPDDILMITADHGCDPSTPSTDHSREYVPLLVYGQEARPGNNWGTVEGFDFVGRLAAQYLGGIPE